MANVTRALFALVTFAAVTSPAAGQQASIDELRLDTDLQKPRFRLTSVEDGLPENSGLTMLQDRQGFLWIGTINGLVRHDGYTFKTYAADAADSTSLQSGLIRHLYEDSDGDIVASTNAGVSFLNPETDEFVTISKSDETSVGLAGTYANFAFEDSRGNYWIASAGDDESEGGLQLFDKESMTFIRTYTADSTREGTLTSNQVVALTEDPDGTLWIATYGGGLNFMDSQTETFGALRHNPGDPTSLASDKVNVVQVSKEGELWVGTGEFFGQEEGGAVHLFDRNTRTFKRYLEKASDLDAQRSSSVVTIEQDAAGTIWVGSVFGGLSRYDRATDAFTTYTHDPSDPESLSGQSILSINSDRSGVLWVGSWSDGISSLNAASGRFPLIEHSPQDPNSLAVGDVMTVYEDRDRILWVGTDIGGLTRIDRFNNTFTRFVPDPRDPRSISHTFARIIYEDRSGVLWVGTFGNGLDRFDRRTGSFTHFRPDPTDPNSISHGSVRAIYEDNRGDFWVGTWGGGLNKLDRATGRFRSYKHDPSDPTSLPDDQISDIFEDTNGRLALTGNNIGDIMVFDPETEGFERIGDRVGVNGGTILVDSKGRTWGSGFGGFISYNPDLTRRRVYGVSDGLPTNVVTNVVESRDGSLWLSTERGLARFDPETERFKVYSRTSGLRLRSYTSLAVHASPTGELFFGGRGGVHAFFPERLVDNPTPPSVAVTEIRIHNKVVDVDPSGPLKKEVSRAESVQLRHDENDLGFTFAAPKRNSHA